MSLTVREVERWMIAAQTADRRFSTPGQDRPLDWPRRFVLNLEHRRAIELWVWCEARGESFRGLCRRRGLPYSTALRHRQSAVERITMLINLERSLESADHLVT